MFSWCFDLFTQSLPLCCRLWPALDRYHCAFHTQCDLFLSDRCFAGLWEIKYLLFNVLSFKRFHSFEISLNSTLSFSLSLSLCSFDFGPIILFIMKHYYCELRFCCAMFWIDRFISWWVENHKIDGNSTIWSSHGCVWHGRVCDCKQKMKIWNLCCSIC